MSDHTLPVLVGALTVLPFVMVYRVAQFFARRRLAAALRMPRPWHVETLRRWAQKGWLVPELVDGLPPALEPAVVFYEWASADPSVARAWRLREPFNTSTPCEALVRDAWANLPKEARGPARERLVEAVNRAESWWGGAERGWNGRPFAILAGCGPERPGGLPFVQMDDLTAAPLPGPLGAARLGAEGDGADLVLALAALRRSAPRFTHPLAPRAGTTGSMVAGLSARVATDVGRRIGGGLGAALGPIGSMVGQYLGELAGAVGGKALAQQALPEPVARAMTEVEQSLARLGRLANTNDFARGASQPSESMLEVAKQLEAVRAVRSRIWRERVWASHTLGLLEEVLRRGLREWEDYGTAGEQFVAAARAASEAAAGGMILQNPWIVRTLPEGAERLNRARAALNQAAGALREAS